MTRPFPELQRAAAATARLAAWASTLGRGFMDLLAPHVCAACGRALSGRVPFCDDCLEDISWITGGCRRCGSAIHVVRGRAALASALRDVSGCAECREVFLPVDCVRSAGEYSGTLRTIVLRYKFHEDRAALTCLVAALEWAFHREAVFVGWRPAPPRTPPDSPSRVVTSVPQHLTRRLWRGRDHGRELAMALARRVGWRFQPLLRKTRRTPTQVSLARGARRRNVRGSFSMRHRRWVPDRVLIVDDVLTTGATVSECASVLKAAGVREVAVLTAARSPARSSGR